MGGIAPHQVIQEIGKIFSTSFNLISLFFTVGCTILIGCAGGNNSQNYDSKKEKKDFFHDVGSRFSIIYAK
jgi:hypothetical protein